MEILASLGIWEKMKERKVPIWVRKATSRFQWNPYTPKPYNVTKHFKGKTFVYKVWFKPIEQGIALPQYYRKRKYARHWTN